MDGVTENGRKLHDAHPCRHRKQSGRWRSRWLWTMVKSFDGQLDVTSSVTAYRTRILLDVIVLLLVISYRVGYLHSS